MIRQNCTSSCKSSCTVHPWYFLRGRASADNRPISIDNYAAARRAEKGDAPEPVRTKREAEMWARRILVDLEAGLNPRRPAVLPSQLTAAPPSVTVAQLLDEFFDRHCTVRHKGQQQSRSLVNRLKTFPLAERPVSVLNEAKEINDLQLELRRRKYSIAYTNRLLETLRAAINWSLKQPKEQRLVERNPFGKYGVELDKGGEMKRAPVLPPSEERRLFSAALLPVLNTARYGWCGPLVHDLLVATHEYPLRIGELLPIRTDDVNGEEHEFRVAKKKSNGDVTYRWLPYDPAGPLGQIFERRLRLGARKYVFGTPDGSAAGKERFQNAWTNVRLASLGVDLKKGPHGKLTGEQASALHEMDLHFHDRRHLTAKRIYRETGDIYFVSLMLGHSNVKTTQRYLQITEEEFRERMREYQRGKRDGVLRRTRLRLVGRD